MALLDEIHPEAEKDQQEPHCSWFWTAVTFPYVTQSIPLADGAPSRLVAVVVELVVCKVSLKPLMDFNSD